MSPLRVAAYCRVSTDREEQAGSLESQQRFFRELIASRPDWELTEVYCDQGISGTSTEKRLAFNRMIAHCRAGLIDTVLTREVSRFARNTVDTLRITRQLTELGVNVIFLSDGIDTADSDGELRLSIMSSIAQEESRRTSERVKWGQRRCMERGVVLGRELLGYDLTGGRLTVEPDGARIVQLIFRKFTAEGKGSTRIARELSEAGIAPPRAEKWSSAAVLRILRNEKYAGDLIQGKTFTPDPLTHKKRLQPDPEKLVVIPEHHQPIISRELWEAAQQVLARRARIFAENSRHSSRSWCSGKVVCDGCGGRFFRRSKTLKSGKISVSWRCSCGAGQIRESVLLEAVGLCAGLLVTSPEGLLREISEELAGLGAPREKHLSQLREQLRQIERKRLNLGKKLAEGVLPDEDYLALLGELKRQQEKVSGQLDQLSDCRQMCRSDLVSYAEKLLSFSSPDPVLIGEITQQITVSPGKLSVKLKGARPLTLTWSGKGRGEGFSAQFKVQDR